MKRDEGMPLEYAREMAEALVELLALLVRLAERGEIDASMIPTSTEGDFFRQMGVPCWQPVQRTEHRLRQFIRWMR